MATTTSALPPRAKRVAHDTESVPIESRLRVDYPMPTDPLGLFTLLRTYSRRHDENDPNSTIETPEEVIRRVVLAGNEQLGIGFTDDELVEAFNVMYNLKGTVAGRFLWQLGTKTVDKNGLISLQNCSYRTVGADSDPVDPFTWTMNFLMCGSGVGFRILPEDVYALPRIHDLQITRHDSNDADYIVPDSREGWIKLLGKVLKGHFYGGDNFSYSLHCLRSKGAPIKGFGGTASGPDVLEDGIQRIHRVLQARVNEKLRPIDCLDIQNIIGQIVVAGNVRRCLPGYAYVHTFGGLRRIDQTQVGDRVLGANGEYYSVANVFFQGVQSVMEIVTEDGSIRSTRNHRHAVYSDLHGVQYLAADQIRPGMFLCRAVHASGSAAGTVIVPIPATGTLNGNTEFPTHILLRSYETRRNFFSTILGDVAIHMPSILSTNPGISYRDVLEHLFSPQFLHQADLLAKSLGTSVYYPQDYWHRRVTVGDRTFTLARVSEIRENVDTTETYDIEVDTVHEFFANGFLTHNSAEIALGDCRDTDYLLAKNWQAGNIPNWRSSSNNSVVCNDIEEVLNNDTFWQGYNGTGEPYGLINLRLARSCGRLGDTRYPDPDVQGVNPCLTGDTWVATTEGPKQIYHLVGQPFTACLMGSETAECVEGFYCTKHVNSVLRIRLSNGGSIRCTPEHRFCTADDRWVTAQELHSGENLKAFMPLPNHTQVWGVTGQEESIRGSEAAKTFVSLWEVTGMFDLSGNLLSHSSEYCRGFLSEFIKRFGTVSDDCLYLNVPSQNSTAIEVLAQVLTSFRVYADSVEYTDRQTVLVFNPYFTAYLGWFVVVRVKANNDAYNDFWANFLPRRLLTENYTNDPQTSVSLRVVEIVEEALAVSIPVYDCGVPEAESFVANGVLTHNCGEQFLCDAETCCLAETFLPRAESIEDLKTTVKVLYRFCKHSLTLPCHASQKTEDIVHRNMRMGIGMTGYLQATETQKSWLPEVYEWLRQYDAEYSERHGFPRSIKLSTCKPSGTLSLIGGTTPGVHPGFSKWYIRRVRISSESPLIDVARRHGLHVEYQRRFDGTQDSTTQIISFPVALSDGTVTASEVSAVQQLEYVRRLQTDWSDNAVSVTVYYRLEELDEIKEYLRENYNDNIKSVSFLLHSDHGFDQAPYEEITEARYNELASQITHINDLSGICYSDADQQVLTGDSACAGGVCPIR